MNKNHKHYTCEYFKHLLDIKGDIFLIALSQTGVNIYTYNDGINCVEGALPSLQHDYSFYNPINDEFDCNIDGDCLCVNRKDFINLAESPAVFIELTKEQIKEIEKLKKWRKG